MTDQNGSKKGLMDFFDPNASVSSGTGSYSWKAIDKKSGEVVSTKSVRKMHLEIFGKEFTGAITQNCFARVARRLPGLRVVGTHSSGLNVYDSSVKLSKIYHMRKMSQDEIQDALKKQNTPKTSSEKK